MTKYRLTFNTIAQAHWAYCKGHCVGSCDNCSIFPEKVKTDLSCGEFVERYPDKAVELMGLEVIDTPALTEQERAMCKAVGAKWVTLDNPRTPDSTPSRYVFLWKNKPLHSRSGKYYEAADGDCFGNLDKALFPSLVPDDCVAVEVDENDK